jgi:hypothetical protein
MPRVAPVIIAPEETQMTTYYVFSSNNVFWGAWEAESRADACTAAARTVGIEGNVGEMVAYEADPLRQFLYATEVE